MEQQPQISKRLWFDSHFQQYKRVWRLLKRPTMQEFKTISKVSAIGIGILGVLGFAISVLMKAFF